MAKQTITVLPKLITAADTENTEVTIEVPTYEADEFPIVTITVISGAFAFAAGQNASNSDEMYVEQDKLTLTLSNARISQKLNYVASAGGDAFKVSY